MKWVENIHLRGRAADREHTIDHLLAALSSAETTPLLVEAEVYRHATIDTDLVVRLSFAAPPSARRPSDLGERLAAALRDQGSVELSVWIQKERCPGAPR